MDNIQKTYEIIKRNLELTDNWYNNPYVPKEKVEVLLKELQQLVSDAFVQGERKGQVDMLAGLTELFENITDEKKKQLKVGYDEVRRIKSYFDWERGFERSKNKLPDQSGT